MVVEAYPSLAKAAAAAFRMAPTVSRARSCCGHLRGTSRRVREAAGSSRGTRASARAMPLFPTCLGEDAACFPELGRVTRVLRGAPQRRVGNLSDSSYSSRMLVKDDPKHQPKPHVCPWWLGPLLANPLRRLIESPEGILGPHVRPGMTVLEPGCGMGYFTLALARMVGPEGRVVAVDVQPRMIGGLLWRARKAGLAGRIEAVVGTLDVQQLAAHRGAVDFAAALHVAHEVADQTAFLRRIHELLRPGGLLLIVEPKGHVRAEAFAATLNCASRVGFARRACPDARGHTALLQRPR